MSLADITEEHKRLWKEFWQGLVYYPNQCCQGACIETEHGSIHDLPFDPATLLDWIERLRASAVSSLNDYHAASERIELLEEEIERCLEKSIDHVIPIPDDVPMGEPVSTTPRGFDVWADFTDTYGSRVRVQTSSAAFVDRVWIFINGEGGQIPDNSGSAHLSPNQAREVAYALLSWADYKNEHMDEVGVNL